MDLLSVKHRRAVFQARWNLMPEFQYLDVLVIGL